LKHTWTIALTGVLSLSLHGQQPRPAATERQSRSGPDAHADYISIGNAKLYYEECGVGAPVNVVLLHDGLLHATTWDPVWQPLCAKYHVLRYDRRGYGRSDAATGPYVPEDDLLQLMLKAKMARAVVVGSSSGGGLALDFALAHPEKTEGLFLIGPVVHGMPSSSYFLERGNRNSGPMVRNDVEATAQNWSQDPFLIAQANPEARKRIHDALSENPQNLKTGGQFELRPTPPTVLRLSQIRAPALVLVGDHDIADVLAYSGAIEAALPIVFFEVWKDTGHLIQLERPSELLDRFNRFARLADRKEMPLAAGELRVYAGQYKFGDGSIGISIREGRLALKLPDLPEKPLFAASAARFFVRTTETEFQFERDAAGNITQMLIYNSDGNAIRCPRL
jgi:3-oxoadipate enol-lactonase